MIQTGWGIDGPCFSFKNMQKQVQACISGVKGTPKGTQKKKKKKAKPYLKLMASVHLNMDYGDWFWVVLYRLWRFRGLLRS